MKNAINENLRKLSKIVDDYTFLDMKKDGKYIFIENAAKSAINNENFKFNARLEYYDKEADLALLELYVQHLNDGDTTSGHINAQALAGMCHLALSESQPKGKRLSWI